MGRVKLKIQRLETIGSRQATYGKRKRGIMKKAHELAVLCDIDIILLMFSPRGTPSICCGQRSIEEVISKFAQLPPHERAKRMLESLEVLKRNFKKLDHHVNIPEFLASSSQTEEDLTTQSRMLQNQLSDAQERLSCWTNPNEINSVEHLLELESSITESLNRIQAHKEHLRKQQLLSIECNNQFQNGMQIPFRIAAEQQLPPMPWITNNNGQRIILPDDPNLLNYRDVECSVSSSLGSYSGYFGTAKSEFSNSNKETVVNGMLNKLTGSNAPLRLQMGGHYPNFLPYYVNVMNDLKYESTGELNQHESPVDFAVNGSFDTSKMGHDTTTPGSWGSSTGPYGITMFDEHLYSQQPN